jgi:voltage-gated potassium channel
VVIHEIERTVQPEAFGTVGNSMWWVLVTLTTVGYGDIYPHTGAGKVVAAFIMLIGLGVMGAYIGIVANATASALGKTE